MPSDEVRAAIERARNKSEVFRSDIYQWTRDYGAFLSALATEPAVCEMMADAGEKNNQDSIITPNDMSDALKALAKSCQEK